MAFSEYMNFKKIDGMHVIWRIKVHTHTLHGVCGQKLVFCYQNCSDLLWEYMFLLAGNIMPGAEKLWGELLFPEEKWLFFSTEGRKNSFSKGNKCSSQSFFALGIMFFSLKDTFSWCFILWPTINHYILMGSDSYCPYRLCIISWPIGRPPA